MISTSGDRTGGQRRRPRLLHLALVAAVGLAACGGDDDATIDTTGDSAATPTRATSDSPSSTEPTASTVGATEATTAPAPATDPGAAPTTATGEEPVTGGSAEYLTQGELTGTFDPAKILAVATVLTDGTAGYLVYGALVVANPDTFEVDPMMAESLTTEDGMLWTLKLREGVTFSDGTPYDAEAVKYNWDRHADPEVTSRSASVAALIAAMEVVDPQTLEITLKDTNFQFNRSVAQNGHNFIASPAALEAGTIDESPVGAGPFILEEWQRDDHMTFVRNPDYWDAPRPYIDEVTLRPVLDDSQRLNTASSGQAVGMVIQNHAGAARGEEMGLEARHNSLSGGNSMYFNLESPVAGDLRFRQAMRLAIDNQLLNDIVDQGNGPETIGFFAQNSPFYDPANDYPARDVAGAQALIDEIAAEQGGPVTFTLLVSATQAGIGDALQAQLAELDNLEMNLEVAAVGIPTQKMIEGSYEVSLYSNYSLDPEPQLGSLLQTGSPRNFMRYSNPEMDELIAAGRSTQDEAERRDVYVRMAALLNEDIPMLTFSRTDPTILYNGDVLKNLSFFQDGIIHWESAWLES